MSETSIERLYEEIFELKHANKKLEQENVLLVKACKSMTEFIKINSWEVPSDIRELLLNFEEGTNEYKKNLK